MSLYLVEREIEGLPPMANQMLRGYWNKNLRVARAWKLKTRLAFSRFRPKAPLEKAKLTLIRVSSKRPDEDGLVSGFKHIIDGLKDCGVIVDDKFEVIGRPNYDWRPGKRGEGKIIVKVEAV